MDGVVFYLDRMLTQDYLHVLYVILLILKLIVVVLQRTHACMHARTQPMMMDLDVSSLRVCPSHNDQRGGVAFRRLRSEARAAAPRGLDDDAGTVLTPPVGCCWREEGDVDDVVNGLDDDDGSIPSAALLE